MDNGREVSHTEDKKFKIPQQAFPDSRLIRENKDLSPKNRLAFGQSRHGMHCTVVSNLA